MFCVCSEAQGLCSNLKQVILSVIICSATLLNSVCFCLPLAIAMSLCYVCLWFQARVFCVGWSMCLCYEVVYLLVSIWFDYLLVWDRYLYMIWLSAMSTLAAVRRGHLTFVAVVLGPNLVCRNSAPSRFGPICMHPQPRRSDLYIPATSITVWGLCSVNLRLMYSRILELSGTCL